MARSDSCVCGGEVIYPKGQTHDRCICGRLHRFESAQSSPEAIAKILACQSDHDWAPEPEPVMVFGSIEVDARCSRCGTFRGVEVE